MTTFCKWQSTKIILIKLLGTKERAAETNGCVKFKDGCVKFKGRCSEFKRRLFKNLIHPIFSKEGWTKDIYREVKLVGQIFTKI